ncbi:putative RNA-directed DNA polymerase [Tanacetum coccineum]
MSALCFFGIQESKLSYVDQSVIRSLWLRSYVSLASSDSLGASGASSQCGTLVFFNGAYSRLKELLWVSIQNLLNSFDVVWIIFGDFNVVRCQDERAGSVFDTNEANSFNEFLPCAGLFDFPLGGKIFTRFEKSRKKANKLDRFLASHNFFDCWNDASVSVLCHSFSDHCPIILKVGSPNFGPNPFRIFDKWIGKAGLKEVISNSWAINPPPQTCDLVLKNKLKKLRMDIKAWSYDMISAQNKSRDELSRLLVEWDVKAETGTISEFDIAKREEWLFDLNHLDQLHKEDLKKKCRMRWAVEGDKNSKFFHLLLNCKYSRSNIKGIQINMVWNESPDSIKQEAFEHFSSRFKESPISWPSFSSLLFRQLSSSDSAFLESVISFDEVKDAVWGCAGSKAPGPDGLIGCVYKVISKILANRLAKVIATVIGPNQSNLIEGRQILDGCLIANEIIIMASIEKLKLLLFKVYFEKAFDSVNWNFLLDNMRQMGFDSKWRNWIASCLSSASISILINGSPTKEFKLEKGLRQSDPLSPFLFLIVAKALQVSILEACNKGFYKGLFLADNNTNISLLQYADDTLFFGDRSNLNAKHLIHILKCFELSLGLKVNISKSRLVGIGVSSSDAESLVADLGCSHEILPFIYLGLPVGKRIGYYDGWNMVINHFRDQLSSWKANSLSIGGRLTLVKSMLGILPIYYLSLFKAPVSIINTLESIRSRFFGVSKNLTMVIKSLYGNDGGFSSASNSFNVGGIWCDIIKAVKTIENIVASFKNSFMVKVVFGSQTSFWKDPWCGDGTCILDIYPRLYALEMFKECRVIDRWSVVNGIWCGRWSWHIPPRGRVLGDLTSLISRLGNFTLSSSGHGKWSWTGDVSGTFKVSSLTRTIQNHILGNYAIGKIHKWISCIPRKVNVCVWRASLNRLPTRSNLSARGVNLQSIRFLTSLWAILVLKVALALIRFSKSEVVEKSLKFKEVLKFEKKSRSFKEVVNCEEVVEVVKNHKGY